MNLFTRPRRFGKSLVMSMLQSFFEIGCDKTLFDGLNISRETELCEKYMGTFPVISISLKAVEGTDYQGACQALRQPLCRPRRSTGRLLVQYQQQQYCPAIYRKSRSKNKKRNRAAHRWTNHYERNPPGPYL